MLAAQRSLATAAEQQRPADGQRRESRRRGCSLPAELAATAAGHRAAAVGAATVALRPDVFTISKDAAAQPSLSAVIRKSSFIGKGVEVVADTSAGELFVFLPHEKLALPVGEEVHLAFPPDEARLTV